MKLTSKKLKQIIKEELRSVLNEGYPAMKAAMFNKTLEMLNNGLQTADTHVRDWKRVMQGLDNIYNLTITKKGTAKDNLEVWEKIPNEKLKEMSEKIDQFIDWENNPKIVNYKGLSDLFHGFDWDKVYGVKEFLNYYLGQGESWI